MTKRDLAISYAEALLDGTYEDQKEQLVEMFLNGLQPISDEELNEAISETTLNHNKEDI